MMNETLILANNIFLLTAVLIGILLGIVLLILKKDKNSKTSKN